MNLPVLYEDRLLLAVDKPAGLLSVPPTTGGERNAADHLRRKAAARGETIWPVHRLDRDTSGVLLFARTESARKQMEDAFRERQVSKRYLALVQGRPGKRQGTIRSHIQDLGKTARSHRQPGRRTGPASTDYQVQEAFDGATLIRAEPHTGRLNQIRLHMVDLGCPILGDRKYTRASDFVIKARRVMLHAAELEFRHPGTGRRLTIRSDPPADFAQLLARLRQADQ